MMEKNELPKGWEIKKLGKVCETTSGGTPSRKDPNFYNGHIPWVKSGELDKGLITDTEEKITEAAIKNSSAKIFPKGTLLIALYGATIGKLAFLGIDAATNQAVCGIFESEKLDPKYLYQFLFFSKADLVKQGIGGAQPNISQGILKNLDIPIPPLPEQHRIVAKIEALFSQLDNGIAQLKTAQAQLKVYRQAVLKWAFEGRLTNTEVVKSKIEEYALLITKGASPRWQGFDYIDDINQLLFITSENVRDNFLDISEPKFLSLRFNEIQKRSILKEGDVLFNLVGASIGRAAIFNLDKKANINQAVAVIRLKNSLNNKYLSYFLNSELAKQNYLNNIVDVARANLSLKDTANIEIPVCSLLEQHRIVQEIESRLNVCDKLEETIAQALQQSEALRQSILKRAFEGRLVK